MEKIQGLKLNFPVSDIVKKDLKEAIDEMHAADYVHGDLRPQNVLVVNNTIRVLDFDWAGQTGVVRYPKELNILYKFFACRKGSLESVRGGSNVPNLLEQL